MTVVDLRGEATNEVRRLLTARALFRRGDDRTLEQRETEGPWMTSPSGRLRAALRGRALLIWRVAFEDPTGRLVDWLLVPVAADADVSLDDDAIVPIVEGAAADWRDEAVRVNARFTGTRLARERAIEAAAIPATAALQPGLFDRRAEYLHADGAAARESAALDQRSRIEVIQQTAVLNTRRPELLLALVVSR